MADVYERMLRLGQIMVDGVNQKNAILASQLAAQREERRLRQERAAKIADREDEQSFRLASIKAQGEAQMDVAKLYGKNQQDADDRKTKREDAKEAQRDKEVFDALIAAEKQKGDTRVEMVQMEREYADHLEELTLNRMKNSPTIQRLLKTKAVAGMSSAEIKREIAGLSKAEDRMEGEAALSAITSEVAELPVSKALELNLRAMQNRVEELDGFTAKAASMSPSAFAKAFSQVNKTPAKGPMTLQDVAQAWKGQRASGQTTQTSGTPTSLPLAQLPPVDPASTNSFNSPFLTRAFEQARIQDQAELTRLQQQRGGLNPMVPGISAGPTFSPLSVDNPLKAGQKILNERFGTYDERVYQQALANFKLGGGDEKEAESLLMDAIGGNTNALETVKMFLGPAKSQVEREDYRQVEQTVARSPFFY